MVENRCAAMLWPVARVSKQLLAVFGCPNCVNGTVRECSIAVQMILPATGLCQLGTVLPSVLVLSVLYIALTCVWAWVSKLSCHAEENL